MFLRWYIYATLYNHSTLFFFEFPRFTPVFSLILYVFMHYFARYDPTLFGIIIEASRISQILAGGWRRRGCC